VVGERQDQHPHQSAGLDGALALDDAELASLAIEPVIGQRAGDDSGDCCRLCSTHGFRLPRCVFRLHNSRKTDLV